MGTLKVIVVAYRRPIHLGILIDCFRVQTDSKWEMHIVHDGVSPPEVKKTIELRKDKRVYFSETPIVKGNYGHPNRRMALNDISVNSNDFILITNDDNYYVPEFVKYIRSYFNPKTGMVYYDCLHNYYSYEVLKCKPQINYIDMGAFVVRGEIAKKVGFTSDLYHADGIYCEACATYCINNGYAIPYLPKAIFTHN